MRDLAEKRHNDWKKAIRKKRISDHYYGNHPWYDNLHQYSKNKIHCSCPLCAAKTNNRNRTGTSQPNTDWKISDQRKLDSMNEQLEDLTLDEIVV